MVRFSERRPVAGSRLVVTGRTTAKPRRVVLQRQTAKGWQRVARMTAKRGQFRFTLSSPKPGARAYRVVVPRVKKRAQEHPRAVSPRVVLRPRAATKPKPVPAPSSTPGPERDSAAAAVVAEVDRLVREYRTHQGLVEHVATNTCLDGWAGDFARRMADTGIFAHSVSSEWRVASVVRADEACVGEAPTHRAEAIDWITGQTPAEVAAAVVANWKSAWLHEEVLLDTFGTHRSFSFGAAQGLSPVTATGERTMVWYVVGVVARDLP